MPDFEMSFVIDSKHVGDVMLALVPFKARDLDVRPVIKRGAKGKPGGVLAWQVVANYVAGHNGPVPSKEAANALQVAGFNRSGVSTHLAKCVKKKLLRSTPKGYVALPAAKANGGGK